MTARPIIPGRAYNVDGVAIMADHPASAIIEYIRIMHAHQIDLTIKLIKGNNNVQNPQRTAFHGARFALQTQARAEAQPAARRDDRNAGRRHQIHPAHPSGGGQMNLEEETQ